MSAEISRPPARRVVVERRPARVIVVDRYRGPRAQRRYWARNGYRPVVVYIVGGRYYDRWDDRWDRRRVDVREVTVFERDGRYYRDWDDVRDYDRWRRDYDRDRD